MATEIRVNKETITAEISKDKAPRDIKKAVEAKGFDWKGSEIFVANFPEKGRYLTKSVGYTQIGSGG